MKKITGSDGQSVHYGREIISHHRPIYGSFAHGPLTESLLCVHAAEQRNFRRRFLCETLAGYLSAKLNPVIRAGRQPAPEVVDGSVRRMRARRTFSLS